MAKFLNTFVFDKKSIYFLQETRVRHSPLGKEEIFRYGNEKLST